jgi:hypothetical protein
MNTKRHEITYSEQFGHVCTCTEAVTYDDNGYPEMASYLPTVRVDRDVAPTDSGSWFYRCERCGACGWSGL